MRIGLINIEPKVVNTALMQIAYYHRSKGDTVRLLAPDRDLGQYDRLYCSSLFTFTDKSGLPDNVICGGTGFDLVMKLPFDCDLDYSLYPGCDCSYLWFSRGCIRNCSFCVVREKEGKLRPVEPKNLNPNGNHVQVQDNNFFAAADWKQSIWRLWEYGQPVDFQGVDVRCLTPEMCKCLKYTNHYKQLKIAWDNPREDILSSLSMLTTYVKPYKIMCYVLIGYWSTPEQDLWRVETLRGLKIDPFVMPYDKADPYQKRFARWVNRKAIFKSVKWEDYGKRVKA